MSALTACKYLPKYKGLPFASAKVAIANALLLPSALVQVIGLFFRDFNTVLSVRFKSSGVSNDASC